MKYLSVFLLIFMSIPVYAATGTGCARDDVQALKYALADLSAQIQVRIESDLYRVIQQSGNSNSEYNSYKIRMSTDLPIYGYKSAKYEEDGLKCVSVLLDKSSTPVYMAEINTELSSINKYVDEALRTKLDSARYKLLRKALTYYDNYEKNAVVVRFLGTIPPTPKYPRNDVEALLIKLQQVSGDIPQIARNIKSQLQHSDYYAHPPRLVDSAAITPFASLLANELYNIPSPESAQNGLYCSYDPSGSKYFLIGCQLIDKSGTVVESVVTSVDKSVCTQVDCYQSANMKKLEAAFRGKINPSSFYGYFYTNYGKDSLMLTEGDVLRLYVRPSRPANLILVGVTPDSGGYLLPLENTAATANTQTEIAVLKVTPPFGTESLVLFGVNGDIPALRTAGERDETGIIRLNGTPSDILDSIRNQMQATGKDFFEDEIIITTRTAPVLTEGAK